MKIDLLEACKATLEGAGFKDVLIKLPDGKAQKESISFAMGIPEMPQTYFDFSQNVKVRITCYIRRLSELAAKDDAIEAEKAIRNSALESINGSYSVIRKETTRPAPLPWDESGRYLYFFEITIEYKEN